MIVELQNKKENTLGIHLPKGVVRVYKQDAEGSLQFVGVAQNLVDFRHPRKRFRISLHGAAGHDDSRIRIVLAGPADRLARLSYGFTCNGARIDDDRIVETGLKRLGAHDLGLISIEPAAKRDDVDAHEAVLAK